MTVTKPPSTNPPPEHSHSVALWAGVAAFFGSLLAIGTLEILDPNDLIKLAGSIFVAFITGGSVYAHERLEDAKREREKLDRLGSDGE
jgi:hypothetical protein